MSFKFSDDCGDYLTVDGGSVCIFAPRGYTLEPGSGVGVHIPREARLQVLTRLARELEVELAPARRRFRWRKGLVSAMTRAAFKTTTKGGSAMQAAAALEALGNLLEPDKGLAPCPSLTAAFLGPYHTTWLSSTIGRSSVRLAVLAGLRAAKAARALPVGCVEVVK